MNFLFLTSNLAIGGTELYALDYASAMQQIGHRVVWATRKEGALKQTVIEAGIILEPCHFEKRLPLHALLAMRQLRAIVQKYNIEIVHAIDAYSALIAVRALQSVENKPKLMWSSVGIGTKSYALMRRLCEAGLDGIVAPSHFIRNRMIEEGFAPQKIIVYSQPRQMKTADKKPADLRREFGLKDTDIVVGSVGRVVKLKGNETLIEAMPAMLKQNNHIRLMIVGDGEQRAELEQRCVDLGIADKVVFVGFRTDIENIYPVFDIVAFPTYYEAMGYIPYEAMFFKKPIVASLTGGIPEIVKDGYNGLLVPPAMTPDWASAILRLAEDKAFSQEISENGKAYYDAYLAYDERHSALENIYLELRNS